MRSKNNFDAVRLILAFIVVFAHIGALTKQPSFDWFVKVFDSGFAVKGFFVISGYLVMNSYISSKSMLDFVEKRVRRIYPGYLFTIIFCLIVGVTLTTLPVGEFLKSSITLKYLLANLTFLNFIQTSLPGVFDSNPLENAMDGSLWSIKVEICLYFLIPFIFFVFKKLNSKIVTLFLVLLSITWNIYFFWFIPESYFGKKISHQFPAYLSFFVIGAFFAFNKNYLVYLRKILFLSFILILISDKMNSIGNYFIQPFFYSSLILWLCTSATEDVDAGRFGDMSYGVYLIHYPLIQIFILLGFYDSNPWGALCLTLLCTVILAFFSWHAIEKPMLKRSSHYIVAANS